MLSTLHTSTVREFFNPHLIDEETEVQVDNLANLTPSMVGKKRGRSILLQSHRCFCRRWPVPDTVLPGEGALFAAHGRGEAEAPRTWGQQCRPAAPCPPVSLSSVSLNVGILSLILIFDTH